MIWYTHQGWQALRYGPTFRHPVLPVCDLQTMGGEEPSSEPSASSDFEVGSEASSASSSSEDDAASSEEEQPKKKAKKVCSEVRWAGHVSAQVLLQGCGVASGIHNIY